MYAFGAMFINYPQPTTLNSVGKVGKVCTKDLVGNTFKKNGQHQRSKENLCKFCLKLQAIEEAKKKLFNKNEFKRKKKMLI